MPDTLVTTVNGHDIKISNLEKVLIPDGITKAELIQYYLKIAPVMLPHIERRPLTFQRFPEGIDHEGFFQKQAPKNYPDWIGRASLGEEEIVDYAMADSAAALVYLAQQAVIVLHSTLARVDRPKNPDLLIFDLDPQTPDFEPVRKTAYDFRDLLDKLGLETWLKTTGGAGLHLAVPLDRRADFDRVHQFAVAVADFYRRKHPDEVTTEMSKAKRGSRLFIDTNRNHWLQTAVAPYSVRAKAGAPVAAPITWDELAAPALRSGSYDIRTVFKLLERRPDPWAGIYKHGQSLTAAEKTLAGWQQTDKKSE